MRKTPKKKLWIKLKEKKKKEEGKNKKISHEETTKIRQDNYPQKNYVSGL